MKLSAALLCSNCYRRTKKVGAILRNSKTKEVEGYLCSKCSIKKRVENRPLGMNWRIAFRELRLNKDKN